MKESNTVGMDLGDKKHDLCVVNGTGQVKERRQLTNTREALTKWFSAASPCRVALEAGTHSGWISRLLESLGHEVIVAQPRKVKAIWASDRKNDASDAEMLARLARVDVNLLCPVRHRSEDAQTQLLQIKARDGLVGTRTKLVNQVRGLAKSMGHRFPSCDARYFVRHARRDMPEALSEALGPLLDIIEQLDERINAYDQNVKKSAQQDYPETQYLCSVYGVSHLTALAFILTIDDPGRFKRSREVGPYLGLVPRQDQSGSIDKQLRITKAGDSYLRRLLVGSAQCIMKSNAPDSYLRRKGERIAARGGKNARKRAVIAVARSLAVLLHQLWVSQTMFDPQGLSAEGIKKAV